MNICDSHCTLYNEWGDLFLNNLIKDSTQDSGQELACYLHLVCDVTPALADYAGPTLTSQLQQAQTLVLTCQSSFQHWWHLRKPSTIQILSRCTCRLILPVFPHMSFRMLREELSHPHTSFVSSEREQNISWNISQLHCFSIWYCTTLREWPHL